MRPLSHTSIIGDRDRRVTIQQSVTTRGASGATQLSYVTVDTVWAALRQPSLRGRSSSDEDLDEMQVVASSDVVWEIRFRSDIDITEKYILVYEGRTYDILSIEEFGRKELWILKTLIQSPNSAVA